MNNVLNQQVRNCIGCSACSILCNHNAIKIEQDKNGFYKPIIDFNKCIGCGVCKKVCYAQGLKVSSKSNINAYFGWHKNNATRLKSASGGITTALAELLLREGWAVFGCGYNHKNRKAEHILINSENDIYKIRGSKYFQSNLSFLVENLKHIQKNKKIAIFGTPCQILGIKNALLFKGFQEENIITIELFCHGVVSQKIWEKYINSSKKLANADDVLFRTKHYGWHISTNEFIVKTKTFPTKRVGDNFFRIFYSKSAFNKACYNCECRKNIGNADLRIGDFWGKRFLQNKEGVSCILSSSEIGDRLLMQCSNNFYFESCDLNEILKSQSYNQTYFFNEKEWNKLYSTLLEKKTIKPVVKCAESSIPFFTKIKKEIYYILSNIKNKI